MTNRKDDYGWNDEDAYWAANYQTRPYSSLRSTGYEYYRPAYRYGYEAANTHQGRDWDDLEADLSQSWNSYEHRGESSWDQIKGAVRDAWDRVRGKHAVGVR